MAGGGSVEVGGRGADVTRTMSSFVFRGVDVGREAGGRFIRCRYRVEYGMISALDK